MTCIVGYADGKKVWIGGDSAGVDGRYGLQVRADSKVFVREKKMPGTELSYRMVFGFTSSFRMGQIIRYDMELPTVFPPKDARECEAWMVKEFVPKLRKALSDGGFLQKKNEEENGGTFLCGVNGILFAIQDDFQVGRTTVNYDAVGCGDHLAIGAMTVSNWSKPADTLTGALSAAEKWSAGVRGPFAIVSTDDGE